MRIFKKKPFFEAPKPTKAQARELRKARRAYIKAAKDSCSWDYSYLLKTMQCYFRWQELKFKYIPIAEDSEWYSSRARMLADLIYAWQEKELFEYNYPDPLPTGKDRSTSIEMLLDSSRYIQRSYVNTKNWDKYIPVEDEHYKEHPEEWKEWIEKYPDELYKEKAKQLFYKAMHAYLDLLWD